MKVLVYPHDLGMGGSQLNAIELAAAVRDLGHDVIVYGRPGVLNGRIDELGLEFVEGCEPGRRPSLRVARQLRRVVQERGIEVVHGYEWPPILEAVAASTRANARALGTVMSMGVAPFIPLGVPLVVGTNAIASAEAAYGRPGVCVIEPPVDCRYNSPRSTEETATFRRTHQIPDDALLLVIVSRLARELKLEGILTAIAEVPRVSGNSTLLIVGDGPERAEVLRAARIANALVGRRAVHVLGQVDDPRPAYAAADIVLGMGGSALRGMAFGKPLVVQGEQGFWKTLTPNSADQFEWTGWYGMGSDAPGADVLRRELQPLLQDAAVRRSLGSFSRELVLDRYSLDAAAVRQSDIYEGSVTAPAPTARALIRALHMLTRYKTDRLVKRLRGSASRDDFNAAPILTRPQTVEPIA